MFDITTTTKIKYPIGGFAPGHYYSRCLECDQMFSGDKYANQCEPCAINRINESHTIAMNKLKKLERALGTIKSANDEISTLISDEAITNIFNDKKDEREDKSKNK